MYAKALYIIIFLSFTSLRAQKEYNRWYFGNKAGLNFNTTTPSVLNDGRMYTWECATSICDKYGKLLFYTNGDTIYNRMHALMLNWNLTTPQFERFHAIQGCMILPVPGKPEQYYIFMGQSEYSYRRDSTMRYWIVDMKGDNGLGELIQKEIPLYSTVFECFGVTLHANNYDYWVASVDSSGNEFTCIRSVDGEFIAAPIVQPLPRRQTRPNTNSAFNNKFSPDSKIFCGRRSEKLLGSKYYYFFELYHFNNSTGQLTDLVELPVINNYYIRPNIEFSSNSRFIYTIEDDYSSSLPSTCIVQYDLSVWDLNTILNSRTIVFTTTIVSGSYNMFGLQIGPDNKIYVFHTGPKLSVINFPDLKGAASNFGEKTVALATGKANIFGGPYYPSFWFNRKGLKLGNDTFICKGDTIELKSNKPPNHRILWSTGDTTASIKVWKTGIYSALLNGYYTDTIKVRVGNRFKVYIGSDTAFCGKFSHLLKAGSGYKTYDWNTGETTMQVTVSAKGIYSVKVLDSNACPSGDTIAIDEIPIPAIKTGFDTMNCKYVILSVDSLKGLTYLWNTGEKNKEIKVLKPGWYHVTASHQFCSNQDSVFVDKFPVFKTDLGPDTNTCLNELVLSTNTKGQYLWNTTARTSSIIVKEPGKYWLTVTRNDCTATDTIDVKLCEDILYYIPNSFTPNEDNINDVFRVYGSNIAYVEMEIYNRWGELLLKTTGRDVRWDGTYKNEMCMESVYFYKVMLKGKKPGSVKYLKGTVTLLK